METKVIYTDEFEKDVIKVYVIKIYDKSEEGNIKKHLLVKLLKLLGFEN
jgi:hypothetical protein